MVCIVEPSFTAIKATFLLPLLVRTQPLTVTSFWYSLDTSKSQIFVLLIAIIKMECKNIK
jgi:hypothetical protein